MEIATLFESSKGTPESGAYEPGVAARGHIQPTTCFGKNLEGKNEKSEFIPWTPKIINK